MYLFLPLYVMLLTIELACFGASIGLSIHCLSERKKSKFENAILLLSITSLGLCFLSLICFALWRRTYLGFIFWINFGLVLMALILAIISSCLSKDKKDNYDNVNKKNPETNELKRSDYIQEIKELKKLLDCGALSQEEFEQRKKKILEDVLK